VKDGLESVKILEGEIEVGFFSIKRAEVEVGTIKFSQPG
jgi:hypothetical protein